MASFEKKGKTNERANALLNLKADDDELIRNLRILTAERDKLADKIVSTNNEGDTLRELLFCSSQVDIDLVYDEFFTKGGNETQLQMTPTENELLVQRFSHLHNYKIQKLLGASIQTIDKRFILVTFLPLLNYTPPELCLLRLEKKGKKFILDYFYGPDVVNVNEFESKYLAEESMDVPSFIHAIHQNLWCYWIRDLQVINIKNEIYMKNSIIYHNRNRTVISFTLPLLMDGFDIEFSLRYDTTSHLPCGVLVAEMNDKSFPNESVAGLEELKHNFLNHSAVLVLRVNLGNESGEGSINSVVTSSTISLAIELFK